MLILLGLSSACALEINSYSHLLVKCTFNKVKKVNKSGREIGVVITKSENLTLFIQPNKKVIKFELERAQWTTTIHHLTIQVPTTAIEIIINNINNSSIIRAAGIPLARPEVHWVRVVISADLRAPFEVGLTHLATTLWWRWIQTPLPVPMWRRSIWILAISKRCLGFSNLLSWYLLCLCSYKTSNNLKIFGPRPLSPLSHKNAYFT